MSFEINAFIDKKNKIITNSNQNLKLSNDFISKLNYCKKYMYANSNGWIYDYLINGFDLISISKKYLSLYYNPLKNKENTCCELLEAFIVYKNNHTINNKTAKYLITSIGIIGSHWYYNERGEFQIIFLTVKDIIKELDGDGFFIWLNKISKKIEQFYIIIK